MKGRGREERSSRLRLARMGATETLLWRQLVPSEIGSELLGGRCTCSYKELKKQASIEWAWLSVRTTDRKCLPETLGSRGVLCA